VPEVLSAPLGPEAVRLLQQALASAKARDPLAPVTVVVPSNYAGLSLRRLLARLPAVGMVRGVANVRFLSLARLADLLAAARLAASGRRPVSPALIGHALRQALAADPGVFKTVAHHPATERSLARAYRELRGCSPGALATLARQSERAGDVVRLVTQAHERVAPEWYDDQDVAAAAVLAAGTPEAEAELGAVVAFCLPDLDAASRRLLRALHPVVIHGTVDTASPPPADLVLTAPDPDEEVRAVLRAVMERLGRGVPLHRMAVLYPVPDPYALLLTQQLHAAGIPSNGPPVVRLRDTVPGRALLGLLRLPAGGWRREDVATWLASAPVLDNGRLVPASQWDVVSRTAGVIEGPAQWHGRLTAHAASLADRLAALPASEAEATADRRWEEVQIEQAEALRRFMGDLVAAAAPPRHAPWAGLVRWANALLLTYLGPESGHGRWPDVERDAWHQVTAAVRSLAALDGLDAGPPPDQGTFLRALEQQLDAHMPSMGTFGDGVFVAPLASARALDVDTVFVVGLAEGTLPGRSQEDALLPDRERRAAGDELPLTATARDGDHEALLAALATAGERVLSWAQADSRQRRALLPSRWLVEARAQAAGDGPLDVVVPSFEGGLAAATEPVTLADYDLADLAAWCRGGGRPEQHALTAEDRRLAAGFEAVAARQSARLTRFDGHVGARSGAASALAGVLSPTSLEVYATCPLKYFLRQVLRVQPTEKPEEIVRLSPMEKGSLVHRILEQYLEAVLAGQPRTLDRLLAIAEDNFADVERRGITGKPLTWQYEQQLIRRELRRFFADDRLTPLAAELAFGIDGEEPVVVALDDGRAVTFRGMADRVDRDADGRLVVTDYKTGGLTDYEDLRRNLTHDPVDRGRKLQLPLYALAAQQRWDEAGAARARYWFTSERGRFETIGYDVDERVLGQFRSVVGTIVSGVEAGVFPARPGEPEWGSYRNCKWCDFDSLCAQDRARAWERKRDAPALSSYVTLAEGVTDATDDE
jgi:RecB family exonuclease